LVKEIINEDGSRDITKSNEVRRVVSEKVANLTIGMLINVVEYGHAKKAQIPGYFIGGKTGTAQIPDKSGYSNDTIHTFIAIAPANDPKFVILTKINKPKKSVFAETSVVPLAKEIMDFMLRYYQVPKER
jgi:cell division protein FtsI/penicillin-binding protein 2